MNKTIQSQVQTLSRRTPNRTFASIEFLQPDRRTETLTYGRLDRRARQAAAALNQHLPGRDNVVLYLLEHARSLMTGFLGGIYAGQIPSLFPVNPSRVDLSLLRDSLLNTIRITGARLLVMKPETRDLYFGQTAPPVPILTPNDWRHRSPATDRDLPDPRPSDTAFLQHSSGTTGLKKGVAISHRALFNQLQSYANRLEIDPEHDRIASWLPLYHDMGLIACFFLPLLQRVPLTQLDPFEWVKDPTSLPEVIHRDNCSLCWLPNFAYSFLANRVCPDRLASLDLSSLRALINCSEPITHNAHQKFLERFEPHGIRSETLATCYAMAENTFALTQTHIQEPARTVQADQPRFQRQQEIVPPRPGNPARTFVSSGTVLDNTTVKVVDEQGRACPDRQLGEIWIKSDCMLTEYYHRPDLTEEAFEGGWYKTGDLGFRIGDQLFVTGRREDIIITAGKNLYPEDIERSISALEEIRAGRVVAFGVRSREKGTEELVVLAEPEHELTAIQLRNLEYEIRRTVVGKLNCSVDHLKLVPPGWLIKSTSGKIARDKCKQKWIEMSNKKMKHLPPQQTSPRFLETGHRSEENDRSRSLCN